MTGVQTCALPISLLPSGAKCRGTCGPDCAKNCVPEPDRTRCAEDPTTGTHLICVYKGVQTCGTHQGCRDHDACYDYCAENDFTSIFDTCHRWCDFGCICEHDAATCIGWALGNPPFDATMTYYDESTSITHGPFLGPCPPAEVMLDDVQRYLDLVDPLEIVSALAEAPIEERRHLAADPVAIELLEAAITPVLWPVARRILDGAPSLVVPSLDEATGFLADRAIRTGDRGRALDIVLGTLRQRMVVSGSLVDWSHVDRLDRGEGLTTFDLHADPAAPRRRRAVAPVTIQIYTPAFVDVGLLFSVVMHEYLHALQVIAGYDAAEFDATGDQSPEYIARDEVESYLWEIEHAVGTGLIANPAQMRELGKRLDDHFADLTDALRDQYRARHTAAHARIDAVVAGRPSLSIDDARRIVAESSVEIADLLRKRPTDPSVDARIEEVRRRRAEALITVALVDNPAIQVVRPGDPGTYRVPTTDAEGRVRFLHGGIQVAWHMSAASTSIYSLGEALSAGGEMSVAGTAIQGRVHPFPPDIDFDEHIHVVATTKAEAGRIAAERIVASIRKISGGRVPGRSDLEFVLLITFPRNNKPKSKIRQRDIIDGTAVAKLGPAIADLDGANMNTFWRGHLADERFTDVTRVIFVSASRPDGSVIWNADGSSDFNLAYLEEPTSIPRTSLAKFAWAMCCDAVDRADKGSWLKAAKRAYNYFSTIGDTAHMAALETVFGRPEANVEQYAAVLDGIVRMLSGGPSTRILTVEEAQEQVEAVADMVASRLPNSGQGEDPAVIAAQLSADAQRFTARNQRGQVARDSDLAVLLRDHAEAIRVHISANLRGQVQPIIDGVVRPECPDKKACERQR